MIAAAANQLSNLTAEIAVLGISIGLLLSLSCYLFTNLSPGGMITPGWIALVLVENPRHAAMIAVTVVLTYWIMRRLQRIVILYGKRLFATVVLVAVFLQMTFFLVLSGHLPILFDNSTLGFIVPGLVAYQLIRQPIVATLTALVTVASLTYAIMLTGLTLGFIPQETNAEVITGTGSVRLDAVRIVIAAGIAIAGLVVLGLSLRRVERARPEDEASVR